MTAATDDLDIDFDQELSGNGSLAYDVPPPPVTDDPAAPYGYTPSGRIRKRPIVTKAKRTAPKPPPRRPGPRRAPSGPDYVAGARGLVQLVAAGFGILAAVTRRPEFVADSATLSIHGEALAQGVGEAAAGDERLARVLEKALQVGPYGALLAPVMTIGAQIAVNHGILKPGVMGTKEPQVLIDHIVAEQEAAEAEAAAAARRADDLPATVAV